MTIMKWIFNITVLGLIIINCSIVEAKRKKQSRSKGISNYSVCTKGPTPPQAEADKSDVAQKCSSASGNGNVRSMTCIQWVASQAEKSFEKNKSCAGKVTVPLMMCIFRKEVTWYSYNPCGVNGCGLAQMTSAGVSTVKRGFTGFGLGDNYDYFWDLVGRPSEKENKCHLTRKSAMDRDTAVAMAATHLCAEAMAKRNGTPYVLARDYNGSSTKNEYARFVTNCIKSGSWKNDPVRKQRRASIKGQCRNYKTCGGRKLSKRHSRRSKGKTNSSGGVQ